MVSVRSIELQNKSLSMYPIRITEPVRINNIVVML